MSWAEQPINMLIIMQQGTGSQPMEQVKAMKPFIEFSLICLLRKIEGGTAVKDGIKTKNRKSRAVVGRITYPPTPCLVFSEYERQYGGWLVGWLITISLTEIVSEFFCPPDIDNVLRSTWQSYVLQLIRCGISPLLHTYVLFYIRGYMCHLHTLGMDFFVVIT